MAKTNFFEAFLLACLLTSQITLTTAQSTSSSPTVEVVNGTYYGLYNPTYNQDLFLGMPYAQPPVGDLRLHVPESLNTSWSGTYNATEYSPECIGYGSDDWVLGNYVSEDCLTINVVRPSGVQAGNDLPVAVWIHGGGFFEGGSSDPRYNLSFILQQGVAMNKPFVAVSMNYRLAQWGFLFSQEILNAGATNLGLRDQRLALHWVQENINAFGGDPSKVTIWGESAGAFSVGSHFVAYGGRDDGLFRGGIQESGGAPLGGPIPNVTTSQPAYDAIVNATNCTSASDTLACLRTVPSSVLSNIFNASITEATSFSPIIDNDFLTGSPTLQLRNGQFVRAPLLTGTNFDEGGSFGQTGINTTAQFLSYILSSTPNMDNATAVTLAALYPDIPEIGIPATLHGRPPPSEVGAYGYQWKRSAAYTGDVIMHAQRRLSNQIWAQYNLSSWSYHWNVLVNGVSPLRGAMHFQEVAFVFHNIQGQGYENAVAVDPFANEPDTFPRLSNVMSRMWVSFITEGDPNGNGGGSQISLSHTLPLSPFPLLSTQRRGVVTRPKIATNVTWPVYSLDNPQNIVFDVNVTTLAYAEPDIYRAEGIQYIDDRLDTVFGR